MELIINTRESGYTTDSEIALYGEFELNFNRRIVPDLMLCKEIPAFAGI